MDSRSAACGIINYPRLHPGPKFPVLALTHGHQAIILVRRDKEFADNIPSCMFSECRVGWKHRRAL